MFRTVARTLNFRKAAEALSLSQPAVTQQVRALEEELGTSLFDRAHGRVSLTPSGAALLPFAEKLAVLAAEAVQAIAELSGKLTDELRLGASQTIAQYLMPHLLAAFRAHYPGIPFAATSGNSDEMLAALADHRIDLALIEGPAMRSDVRSEAFMEDHMVLVVPHTHPWADRDIGLEQLETATFVTREYGSGSRRVVEEAFEQAGVPWKNLTVAMTLDTTEGLLSAVEAGLGIAFASRWAVRNQLTLGTLKLARVKGLRLARVFSVAHRHGPDPQGSAGAFHRFVLTSAQEAAPRSTGAPPRKRSPSRRPQ